MPAGSKINLPLAKAKPISNSGSISGIIYSKAWKKKNVQLQPERGVKREAALLAPRPVKEREKVLQASEQRFPCNPWRGETMLRQVIPLLHMEVHDGAEIHLLPTMDAKSERVDT
ncbi:hypothetical protein BTVI_128895 [Pitangus sulphuratus]|nr:hypothetical protein BTVI_128895 [Pitangus sulphuratus]